MVVPSELLLMFITVWVLWWHCLVLVHGHGACSGQHDYKINISTHLQSDVLLPCVFNSSLLGSDLTANVAAVWIYKNITEDSLLEIRLNAEVRSWNTRGGRINSFPKLSTSGNFSILLHNVNKSDLGLYRCELHNGTNCNIAYQEIQLGLSTVCPHVYHTSIIAGTSGGAVLLLLIILLFYIRRKRTGRSRTEGVCGHRHDPPIYENLDTIQPSQSKEGCTRDRPITTQYATVQHSQSRDEGVYENPIYTRGKFLDKPDQSRGTSVPV